MSNRLLLFGRGRFSRPSFDRRRRTHHFPQRGEPLHHCRIPPRRAQGADSLDGKIRGSSGFAEKFASQGPQDSKGRSLRQFDLERRLMRYPCSYMIYSEAFDSLPAEAKDAIYQRMWSVLSGKVSGGKYARLSPADRRAVVEILRETKKGMPDYYGTAAE